ATHRLHQLRFRATDFAVHERTGRWPLSVSSDLIAVPALRAARLFGAHDRSGAGVLVEVYPAAALRIWGFSTRGYKGPRGGAARCPRGRVRWGAGAALVRGVTAMWERVPAAEGWEGGGGQGWGGRRGGRGGAARGGRAARGMVENGWGRKAWQLSAPHAAERK